MQISQQKTDKINKELENEFHAWNNKQRYGLFSYLPHHGFGVRDQNEQTTRRDEGGNVRTGPKNFQGGRPKSAVLGFNAFSKTGFLSANDEYVDPTSIMKYRDNSRNKQKEVHGQAFKPSHNGPKVIKAPYEYISEAADGTESAPNGKNARSAPNGQNGQNATSASKLRNFTTNPGKRGYGNTTTGHTFSSHRYVPDPYSFPDMLNSMERQQHRAKFMSGPFQLTYKKRDHFTPNYKVYRTPNGHTGYRPQSANPDAGLIPFLSSNPAKKGYNCTLNKFPEYIEEMEKEKPATKREGIWRYNPKELSQPSHSVNQYNAKLRITKARLKV